MSYHYRTFIYGRSICCGGASGYNIRTWKSRMFTFQKIVKKKTFSIRATCSLNLSDLACLVNKSSSHGLISGLTSWCSHWPPYLITSVASPAGNWDLNQSNAFPMSIKKKKTSIRLQSSNIFLWKLIWKNLKVDWILAPGWICDVIMIFGAYSGNNASPCQDIWELKEYHLKSKLIAFHLN